MTNDLPPLERAKLASARRAADFVESDMKVGLGTGSTADWLVRCLGNRVRGEGLKFIGVATSQRTANLSLKEGIPTIPLDEAGGLDLTIDGADEYDPELNLIKGGGGALLREKIVAKASKRMVVIADPSKRVDSLGAFPLPVAVTPFGWRTTKELVEKILIDMDVETRHVKPRMDGNDPYATDEGNFILDLHLGRIGDPPRLAAMLNRIPGVVENGLFIGICDAVVVGHPDERIEEFGIDMKTNKIRRIEIFDRHGLLI